MSERKNIDRLFQEKFKDFEVNPPEAAWANIEAKLDNKKKRRVIPFWWKLSGVAAVFLIGFMISKSIYDDGIKTTNPIVNDNNSGKTEKTNAGDLNKKSIINKGGIASDNAVANKSDIDNTSSNNGKGSNKNNTSVSSENAVAATSKEVKSSFISKDKNQTQKTIYSSTTAVTERKSSHKRSLKNQLNSHKEKATIAESPFEKSQEQVAQHTNNNTLKQTTNQQDNTSTKNNKSATDNELVQTDSKETKTNETPISVDKKNINLDDLKGNNNSKIATKETAKKVNDTVTAINSVATNELEELLNEKESKKKESKRNRWQLASNVAPIFLGSAASGSAIDSTLSKNSKSFNTNVGFGIGVSYAVNNKLSIRTGLNKVKMSYDTNDISFFEGMQAKTLSGVKPTASSAMIHVESTIAPTGNPNLNPEAGLLPFEASFAHKTNGALRQEMSYLEMPVEMTYTLLDKKFGIKVIGGFSALLLQDNNIVILSSTGETDLGEANNLNDVHFSTNLGLGVKYNFLKSFEFNVEPTVKYQLNTYNSGNFKSYLFGIYSGISYKF